jgi:hypothetical protein
MTDKKEITPRQTALIDALVAAGDGDIRSAMTAAGYSTSTSIREAVKPIQDEIISAATLMIAMNSPKAAGKMVGVLGDPAALGAKNTISAAKEILDRAGVVKTEKIEVAGSGGGMFILPPKKSEE